MCVEVCGSPVHCLSGTGRWGVINRLSVCLLTHCNLLLWGNRVINSQHRRFVLALARPPSCEASWRMTRGQVTYDAGQDQWPFITIHIADKFLHKLASYVRLLKVLSAPFVWRLFIETFSCQMRDRIIGFWRRPQCNFTNSACQAPDFGHCMSNKDLYECLSWNCIFKNCYFCWKVDYLIHSPSLKFTWPNHVRATVWTVEPS